MNRGRNVTLLRILRLAKRLRGVRQLPVLRALAEELGVNERTLRRDIYALEETGWIQPPPHFYASDRRSREDCC